MIFDEVNQKLFEQMPHYELLQGIDVEHLPHFPGERQEIVCLPNETYQFLHEAAIISFQGVLFAAWYNNPKKELIGFTPIRYARSYDDGKTWEKFQTVAQDETGKTLFCPPVFGIEDDKLYLFMNQMVAPDHIHALDLYVFDPEKDTFVFLWSRPIPFKLNTNITRLPNGKLILFGRVAELDGFPQIPAVLLSDSGHIDAEWRLIKIQENRFLPDGESLIHPEISGFLADGITYIFCRDDCRTVPLIYVSRDNCETFESVAASTVPFSSSKIYAGTLSNGVNYAIGNLDPERKKLAIFFTEPGSPYFTKAYQLQNGYSEKLGVGAQWHYPVADEANGKLYIIYTVNTTSWSHRGAALSVLPIGGEE